MPVRDVIIDLWSPLSHKEPIGQPNQVVRSTLPLAPSWVPDADQRRLAAYKVRAAYRNNVARLVLPLATDDAERDQRREYGDPSCLSDRIVASILGKDWGIVVDGADDNLLDGPKLPERPTDPAADAGDLEKRIHQIRLAAWEREAAQVVDLWEQAVTVQPELRARQTALRDWVDDNQIAARIDELEHDAVDLADGVVVFWPREGDWPTVEVWDPGFYFPELDGVERGEFPDRVHIAFEYADDGGANPTHIRRLTWELVDLTSLHAALDRTGDAVWIDAEGNPLPDGQLPALADTDKITADGTVVRTLPWHEPDDPPAERVCVFSDGSWPLSAVQAGKVTALDEAKATWRTWRQDMGADFLLVIHHPNTATGKEHFGRAVMDHVVQVLDDLAQIDTRIMGASQYVGEPTVALEDATVDAQSPTVLMPGQILTGKLTTLDLSGGIDKLLALGGELQRRWWQNLGAPRELLGAADASTTSGLHLALKFAPWAQVVGALRLPREHKYRLFLKMAQRLAQLEVRADGTPVLPAGPTPRARLQFGPFLPANQAEVLGMVKDGVTAHILSIETGVAMLVGAGFPIVDAQAEVERILAEDTSSAVEVADALAGAPGAAGVVADRLGVGDRVGDPAPVAPTVVIPPVP